MKKTRHNKEKGSALLLTLGILSLVLILAMSFAFTARTNRQVSKVNADQVKAKLLAESGLARVLGGMQYNFNENEKLYPASDSSVSAISLNLNSKPVKTKETSNPLGFHFASVGSTKSEDPDPNKKYEKFEDIVDNHLYLNYLKDMSQSFDLSSCGFMTIKDSDNKIIGRVGALILEEGGKFDINQLINRRKSNNVPFVIDGEEILNGDLSKKFDGIDSASPKDFYYPLLSSYSFTGDTFCQEKGASTPNALRLGMLPQEIYVDKKYYDELPNGFAISSTSSLKAIWFSPEHLINRLGNAQYVKYHFDMDREDSANALKNDIFAFTCFSMAEPESFITEFNGTEYARFDLTGYENGDRETSSFYDASGKPVCKNEACAWYTEDLDEAKDLIDELVTSEVDEWETFDGGGQTAIPFLSVLKGSGLAVGDFREPLGKHVAANMIDFCDEDNKATLDPDFNFTAEDPVEPSYCGNEKVPYINEIAFDVHVSRVGTMDGKSYEYVFEITPTVELINIFDEAVSYSQVSLRVFGKITTFTCENPRSHGSHLATISGTTPVEKNFTFTTPSNDTSIPKTSTYKQVEFGSEPFMTSYSEEYATTTTEIAGDPPMAVTYYHPPKVTFKYTITKIIAQVTDGTDVLDIAYCDKELDDEFTIVLEVDDVDPDKTYYASLQAIDPRCNHRSMDWYWNKTTGADPKAVVDSEEGDVRTLEAINKLSDEGEFNTAYSDYGEKDKESSSDQKYHNAYIKNAPFESFWELGTIHRAEPFRTIRLTKFKQFTPGEADGIIYNDGDAAILDQLKIGPVCYSKGKFNSNSRIYRNYWDVLFRGIKTDDDIEHESITQTVDTPFALATVAGWSWPSTPSISRAAFVAALPTLDDDMESEALIGRTANLLTTRSDAYTIIIVAQSMSELMEDVEDAQKAALWDNADYKKSLLNPTKYDDKYFSILGTKVLTVNVIRDAWIKSDNPSGKPIFTIVRKSYMDE